MHAHRIFYIINIATPSRVSPSLSFFYHARSNISVRRCFHGNCGFADTPSRIHYLALHSYRISRSRNANRMHPLVCQPFTVSPRNNARITRRRRDFVQNLRSRSFPWLLFLPSRVTTSDSTAAVFRRALRKNLEVENNANVYSCNDYRRHHAAECICTDNERNQKCTC